MNELQIDSMIFFSHILLLASKLAICVILAQFFLITKTPKENLYMIVFNKWYILLFLYSLAWVGLQTYFIVSFFIVLDWMPKYEAIAVLDESLLGFLLILYLIKEAKNGKKS
jgi:hypothetical protein